MQECNTVEMAFKTKKKLYLQCLSLRNLAITGNRARTHLLRGVQPEPREQAGRQRPGCGTGEVGGWGLRQEETWAAQ
jgi:hypothetical protein